MKIALAQINSTVGALKANSQKILEVYRQAEALGAELVVFPELALTGYPPKDLLDLPDFIQRSQDALEALAAQMTGPGAVVGCIWPDGNQAGKGLYNAAALIDGGRIVSRHFKSLLPTYDVFDEGRHFEPAHEIQVAHFRGRRMAITICEDFWNTDLYSSLPRRLYHRDPVEELAAQGIDLIVHIAASPYSMHKRWIKAAMYQHEVLKRGVPLVQVNLVGGNDNLIFDGWSNAWNTSGEVIAQAAQFAEDLVTVDVDDPATPGAPPQAGESPQVLYEALKLGIRDYVRKCGFKRVLLGLSGGIDSALTAVLAADALGPENVVGISMPSQFSSQHSRDDAAGLARNLGIEYHTVAVGSIYESFMGELGPLFEGTEFGLAEENLQARVRGTLLMTLSNKFGYLVLTTGNKSEMAVGYCTLYGDMNGGLAVLADVLKTRVYELARWINREGERIPASSIEKPPSAELRPGQLDQDSLPPYEELDPIIAAYVERGAGVQQIVDLGHERATVERIIRMIDRTEYKRIQAALCLKVTTKAFGSGRRMPIARGE